MEASLTGSAEAQNNLELWTNAAWLGLVKI